MREGWTNTTIGEVCQVAPSKREARSKLDEADLVSVVPMSHLGILTKDIAVADEQPLRDVVGSYTYFAEGDVLLAKITPCFENGKLGVARNLTNRIGFGSSEFIVLRPQAGIDAEFLFYFLSQNSFRSGGSRNMKGAAGQKRVPKPFVQNYPISVPPVAEQKRIVAILDEAFAGIDAAVANAEKNLANAGELFETHLSAAFVRLRRDHEEKKLKEICDKVTVGYVGPMVDQYRSEGVPFLRSKNVRPFAIDRDDLKFISPQFNSGISKSALRPGDVAIVRTGYPGTAAVIPDDLPGANCSDLVIARPGQAVDGHYLALFLNSGYGKSLVRGRLTGAAQKHFNVTAAKEVPVPLPDMGEQRRVVDELHRMRASSDQLQSTYIAKELSLERLRGSILQKAFAGELTAKKADRDMAAA